MTPLGTLRRTARLHALRRARNALRVVFQPIRRLDSGETVGYEALSRFPDRAPDAWFAEAHLLGGGVDLEMRAVLEAMADADPSWGYVSINVSPQLVTTPVFTGFVRGLPRPDRVVLELTEHAAVADYEGLCSVIARLRDLGLRIAVDDAGGGISSFRHILAISPEIIKLDRSLIAGLHAHRARQVLAESIADFARRTGAQLVAEGIECGAERAACLECGIELGQGFLLGEPQPARWWA